MISVVQVLAANLDARNARGHPEERAGVGSITEHRASMKENRVPQHLYLAYPGLNFSRRQCAL